MSAANRQFILGTAGHIDHGKTALVKALTGIDTDRLPEEKARGITIDIGFAHWSDRITFIDVPGHERLIKNMVAGVSTIDAVLFVVAADDGVMPQSREHMDIISLLNIRHGVIAITKTDLVEPEWLKLVEEDVRSLVRDTPFQEVPVIHTSAVSGEGIETLHKALEKVLEALPARRDASVFRLPADRVFTVRGFGTVVTGTVLGGRLSTGDTVDIQPLGGSARVRGLQSHDREVEIVETGDRAAINLAGLEKEEPSRGMVLVQAGLFTAVNLINGRLSVLSAAPVAIKNNQRLRLHIHTTEVFGRVIIPHRPPIIPPGESAFVQIRLETPVHAAFRDRFVIRQYSPQRTLGGGVVLQTNPFRYRKKYAALFQKTLERLESDDPRDRLPAAFDPLTARPLRMWDLKIATQLSLPEIQAHLKKMSREGAVVADTAGGKTVYFAAEQLSVVLENIEKRLSRYHRKYPGRAGLREDEMIGQLEKRFPAAAIRRALAQGVQAGILSREGESYRLQTFTPELSARDSETYVALEACYREAGFAPPTIKEAMAGLQLKQKTFKELIHLLREENKLIYADETLLFHETVLPQALKILTNFFRSHEEITVPEFKELIGTTRKHAIPLLEYLDRNGYTERDGDVRRPAPKLLDQP